MAAELFAILNSLKWLIDNPQYNSAVVFTDSLASCTMIEDDLSKTYFYLISSIQRLLQNLKNNLKNVIIQWIPSHCIPQNDLVDSIAKQASVYNNITELRLDSGEYKALIKHKMKNYQFNEWEINKNTLKFAEVVPNIKAWKWISSGSKHCDAVLARLRSGYAGVRYFY